MALRRHAWLAAMLMMAGGAAQATGPLALAANELAAGNYAAALHTIESLPAMTAATADARFLHGTALMGSGRLDEAAAMFEALVAEQPHLPEAYNNLAAVYVRQGRLDEAKQVLERALATDPRYATVYENLSTIYVEMARSSYAKALRLDPAAQGPRLAVMTMLQAPTAVPVAEPVAAVSDPAQTFVVARAATGEDTAAGLVTSPPAGAGEAVEPAPAAASAAAESVTATVEAAEPVLTAAVAAVEPEPESSAPAEVSDSLRLAVLNAVEGWARAWSEQNPDKYLAFYAGDYAPEDMARSAWEAERRSRLSRPAWIKVTLEELEVAAEGAEVAVVTLKQRYAASNYKDTTFKRLTLVLRDGNWVITSEISLGTRR